MRSEANDETSAVVSALQAFKGIVVVVSGAGAINSFVRWMPAMRLAIAREPGVVVR
jgi:hypothetical protein